MYNSRKKCLAKWQYINFQNYTAFEPNWEINYFGFLNNWILSICYNTRSTGGRQGAHELMNRIPNWIKHLPLHGIISAPDVHLTTNTNCIISITMALWTLAGSENNSIITLIYYILPCYCSFLHGSSISNWQHIP